MKHYLLYAAAATAGLLLTGCKEAYDLDERLPEGFGTTLYSYLDENDFQNVKRLADDLGYAEALQGRSLKTMFAADDEAFSRFYADNHWGVTCYDDLSLAQKKMLFYGCMMDNSIQIMNLSNTTSDAGVVTGNAMRRATALTVYDTVPRLLASQLPDNRYWYRLRNQRDTIVCMCDMSVTPLTFFTEPFLVQNRITNDDVDFLFNYAKHREPGDANVGGIDVVIPNRRCANGFVNHMAEVVLPLDNMAETLLRTPDLSQWSSFVERYSVPVYAGREVTDNYNFEYGTQVDSVFTKRYLANRSNGGTQLTTNVDNIPFKALLKFDPGWNAYYSDDPNTPSSTVAMQKNMGVMLVPSNEALNEYWENGTGRVLKDYYGSWERVPDDVLVKLLNNNMLNSFVGSVPSKFYSIVNSTKDPMGIETKDVDRVIMAGNGAIYVTNKVFSPTEYVSVSFPALVNETMNILYWAIEQLEYSSYLNSIDSYYSFFIPTNDALQNYVDPQSYDKAVKEVWHFHYKANAQTAAERVWASVFAYDPETGMTGDSLREERGGGVTDRLKDVLNNHIVVGNIESGRDYYQTKSGNTVRVVREGNQIVGVQGSFQSADVPEQRIIPITKIYDQSREGNGKSYILDAEPILTTSHSALDIIAADPDCSVFLELLQGSELYKSAGIYSVGNISTFNNYNYTVYVPTNETMEAYLAAGDIKTWKEIAEMEEYEGADEVYMQMVEKEKAKINAFLRYHIQDNSVFVGQEFAVDGSVTQLDRTYETAIMNEATNKFYTVRVQADQQSITLTDNASHKRHVITTSPTDYNQPAREMQSNSFAVVHKIDGPLFYTKELCTKYDK